MQDINGKKISELLTAILEEYIINVNEEFRHLWNSWVININHKEIHEVIGGIIARQISLATHFIISTNNWTNEIAPIILRSMADNYINFSWILKDPHERVKKFIAYGLGQEKLIMEHRKNQAKEDGIDIENAPTINESKKWIDKQQYDFLTTVNIANWAGISVYKMAEEAECKDFYNYVYLPFSVAVHNMWNHIGKHNVRMSDNPLHKFLLIPTINEPTISINSPILAAKYVDICLEKFHKQFNIDRHKTIAYIILYDKYNDLLT